MRYRWWLIIGIAGLIAAIWIGQAIARVEYAHRELAAYIQSAVVNQDLKQTWDKFLAETKYDMPPSAMQFLSNPFRRDIKLYYYRYLVYKDNPDKEETIPYPAGYAYRNRFGQWKIRTV